MRCLAKAPEARYQRGAELAAALDAWLHEASAAREAHVRGRTPAAGSPPALGPP
jgi:hypothetical protein